MAWSQGADPYAIYNGLDSQYRPLSHRHPCPACWSVREAGTPQECELCGFRGYIEFPLDEPGDPQLPAHPRRLRNFLYGLASAVEELRAKNQAATSVQ